LSFGIFIEFLKAKIFFYSFKDSSAGKLVPASKTAAQCGALYMTFIHVAIFWLAPKLFYNGKGS